MRARLNQQGFALPTILISSVVMLIVLTAAVSAASSVRSSLENQYYNQIAREAAESGLALAMVCLRQNEYQETWSGGADGLRPTGNCTGSGCTGTNCYLVRQSTAGPPFPSTFYRSTFWVGTPSQQGYSQEVTAFGLVELVRPDGSVGESFDSYMSMRVGNSTSLGEINPIIYGQ